MDIETAYFKISKSDYFKVVLSIKIRKKWWFALILLGLAIYEFLFETLPGTSGLIVKLVGFIYPIFTLIHLYVWTYFKKGHSVFVNRKIRFTDELIYVDTDPNAKSELGYSLIEKVIKVNQIWMLYISRNQFIPLDVTKFTNTKDLETLTDKLIMENLIKK